MNQTQSQEYTWPEDINKLPFYKRLFYGRMSSYSYGIIQFAFIPAILLLLILVYFGLEKIDSVLGSSIVTSVYFAIFIIPLVVFCYVYIFICTIKRLHDLNTSGFVIILLIIASFIPFTGLFVWLYLIFTEGTPGPNRYGPDPKKDPAVCSEDTGEKSWLDLGIHSFVKIAIVGVLIWWIFREEINSIVYQWLSDPSWSHGFLIPLFSLYFLNQSKNEIIAQKNDFKPNWGMGLIYLIFFLLVLYPYKYRYAEIHVRQAADYDRDHRCGRSVCRRMETLTIHLAAYRVFVFRGAAAGSPVFSTDQPHAAVCRTDRNTDPEPGPRSAGPRSTALSSMSPIKA